jgi:hypothetical protein
MRIFGAVRSRVWQKVRRDSLRVLFSLRYSLSLSLSEANASKCGSGAVKERYGGAGEEGALDFY